MAQNNKKADTERGPSDRVVDENSEESFPASDAPSYSGGSTVGAPPRQPDDGEAGTVKRKD